MKTTSSAESLIERGLKLFNDGRPAPAEVLFTRALALQPGNSQAVYFRAHARHSAGRRIAAWKDLRAVLGDSEGPVPWLAAAEFEEKEGKFARALRSCVRALSVSKPDDRVAIYERKGDLESRLGQNRESLASFLQALSLGGRNARVALKVSQHHEALGNLREALVYVRRAGTDDARRLKRRLEWRLWIGNLEERVPLELRVAAEAGGPGSAAAWRARAEAELISGLIDRAETSFRRAIAKGAPLAERLIVLQARRREEAAAAQLISARDLANRGLHRLALKRCSSLPSPEARILEAELCARLGCWERAVQTAEAVLKSKPRDAHLMLKVAELQSGRGRQDLALLLATAACRESPQLVEAWLALSEAQAAFYLEEEARRSAFHALALSRQASEILRAAIILHRLGLFPAARKALNRACRLSPEWAEPWVQLAQLELWEGRTARALSCARRALSLEPGRFESLRAEAGALVLSGRAARALPLLEQVLRRFPQDAEALTWRGEALMSRGRPVPAKRAFEAACARGSYPLAALLNLELILLAKGKRPIGPRHEYITTTVPAEIAPLGRGNVTDPVRYIGNLKRALRALEGNRSLDATFRYRGRLTRHVHFFPRGPLIDRQTLLRFGDARIALRPFDRILGAEPREAYPYSHRAEVYLWLGRYARAGKDFRRALMLNDALLWPKIGLATVALLRGNPALAIKRLEYASGRGGSDSILSTWWGESLRRLGRPREALERLSRIPETLPYRPAVWLNTALCRLDLKQTDEAWRLYAALRQALPEFIVESERAGLSGRSPKSAAQLRRVLEKALTLMRGNRSSWFYSYYQGGRPCVMRLHGVDRKKAPAILRGYSWAFAEEGRL